MSGNEAPPRGIGSPAEACERLARAFPQLPAEHIRQLVIDGTRKSGAVVIDPYGNRRDVKGAEIAESWFDFGADEPSEGGPALISDADYGGAWSLALTIAQPRLELDLLDIDQYAAAVLGGPSAAMVAPSQPRNRGGRPASTTGSARWGKSCSGCMTLAGPKRKRSWRTKRSTGSPGTLWKYPIGALSSAGLPVSGRAAPVSWGQPNEVSPEFRRVLPCYSPGRARIMSP